ncbi:MAG: hypothetical protein KAX49_07170 [Halanaerobiales bacterium]|nr:hypothetical protein [Halanaerobiales bacterium]
MKEFLKKLISIFTKYSDIEIENKFKKMELELEQKDNVIKQKDNMIEAMDQNKLLLKEQLMMEEIKNNGLKNEIKDLQPKGNIALELKKEDKIEFKWVSSSHRITDNFKVYEFMQGDELQYLKVNYKLPLALEMIKEHFNGAAVIIKISKDINRGFRSFYCNKAAGGSSGSKHQYGWAADITVKGKSPTSVQKYIEENYVELDIGGLGKAKAYTHVDIRPLANGKLTIWTY